MVAGRSRRLTTLPHDPRRPAARRQDDQERHADLRAIETLAVVEQIVLPQSFAMIGGDDHQRSIEHAAPLQVVEQLAQPLVQIGEAVVIGVSSQESDSAGPNWSLSIASSRARPGG